MRIVVLSIFIALFGCGPKPATVKTIANVLKRTNNLSRLNDKMITNIKRLTKVSDKATIDNMKEMIAKGGRTSSEATIAYNNAYRVHISNWGKIMTGLRMREQALINQPDDPQRNMLLKDIYTEAKSVTTNLLDILDRRLGQMKEILDDVDSSSDKRLLLWKLRSYRYLHDDFRSVVNNDGINTVHFPDSGRWFHAKSFLNNMINKDVLDGDIRVLTNRWEDILHRETKFENLLKNTAPAIF